MLRRTQDVIPRVGVRVTSDGHAALELTKADARCSGKGEKGPC